MDMRLLHLDVFPYDLGQTAHDLLVIPMHNNMVSSLNLVIDMQQEPEGLVDMNEG